MSPFWIAFHVALIPAALMGFYLVLPKKRAVPYFQNAYLKALKVGQNEEGAIIAALTKLQTSLPLFTWLSQEQIRVIAQTFKDVKDPHEALTPLIEHASQEDTLKPLIDLHHLESWKAVWQKETA